MVMRSVKWMGSVVLGLVLMVFVATRFSPRFEKWERDWSFVPDQPEELVVYLDQAESSVRPKTGTEKTVFFPHQEMKKKPLSFIYLHGFSASRQEVSPVFEKVATYWSSPLYFTRLFGHGLGSEELGRARWRDWIFDAQESYQIGLRLGEEVVIGCVSTGCALALYLAAFYPEKIRALVFLSPNFYPADPRSILARGPLGPLFTRWVLGATHEFKPHNSEQAYFWTYRYGAEVIPEVMALVGAVRQLDLSRIEIPLLTLYTPYDEVVSAEEIEIQFSRFGSVVKHLVPFAETHEHILGGDIMNPTLTQKVVDQINQFLLPLVPTQ